MISALILADLAASAVAATVSTTAVVNNTATGQSIAEWKSLATGFDAPHVSPINASSYEWWYFDAVSDDGLTSVVFTFYTAPTSGFLGGGPSDNILPATITVGTPGNEYRGFYERRYATEAVIEAQGNGASGQWVGTGYEFRGAPDLSTYEIKVASASHLVNGTVNFKAVAPAHYPCGPVGAGRDMFGFPGLGWTIGISDAIAEVELHVNGTAVKFTGLGYHDKNHGNIPFQTALLKTTWGHGRTGPYSVVWALPIERSTGKTYSTGYVAANGKTLGFGCNGTTVTLSDTIGQYQLDIKLDDGSDFRINTMPLALIDGNVDDPEYQRWSGQITGGLVGGPQYTGGAMFEHFDLSG
ncbi:Fc.00g044580.m01.CDS01 [Cosmosporella sp. VM-42]